jgi:hypothetical protein
VIAGYIVKIVRDPANFGYEQQKQQFAKEKGLSAEALGVIPAGIIPPSLKEKQE